MTRTSAENFWLGVIRDNCPPKNWILSHKIRYPLWVLFDVVWYAIPFERRLCPIVGYSSGSRSFVDDDLTLVIKMLREEVIKVDALISQAHFFIISLSRSSSL